MFVVCSCLRCSGWQLSKVLARRSFFPEQSAAWRVKQIATTLADLHAIGVAHRDVHPRNIMYSEDSPGSVLKLIDFGFASQPGSKDRPGQTS